MTLPRIQYAAPAPAERRIAMLVDGADRRGDSGISARDEPKEVTSDAG